MPRSKNGKTHRSDYLVSYTVTNYVTVRADDEEDAAARVTRTESPRYSGRDFTIKSVEAL